MNRNFAKSFRVALALLLTVAAALAGAPTASGQEPALVSQEFKAIADSYVSRATPARNFGRARLLKAGGGTRTFIKFDVSEISGAVTQAQLHLRVVRGQGRQTIRAVGDNNWTEQGIRNTSAPKLGPALGSYRPRAGRSVTVDVGPWISQNGIFTFAIVSRGKTVSYASRSTSKPPRLVITTDPAIQPGKRVFAYYFLRWSDRHWHDKLGPNYPYNQSPLPFPANVASNGCGATSNHEGNQLLDVPAALYTQDTLGVIEQHVRRAAEAGISGFIVSWHGTGLPGQVTDDLSYSRRLDELVRAVNEVNAQGVGFKLWINYKASTDPTTVEAMTNDLDYLKREYGTNNAMDHRYSTAPLLVWGGSRHYLLDFVGTISARFRTSFFLVGDESWDTWGDGRATHFDGNQYYWPSQNPDTNPESFGQLQDLANQVRSSGSNPDGSTKLWFAPFTPGYNTELLGRETPTCVPRNDGQTMQKLFEGNSQSTPDEWVLISWNGIAENTHVEPLQRWGDFYLNLAGDLITE